MKYVFCEFWKLFTYVFLCYNGKRMSKPYVPHGMERIKGLRGILMYALVLLCNGQ